MLLDACLRDRRAHLGGDDGLAACELGEVGAGARAVRVEPLRAGGEREAAVAPPGGERRLREADDHARHARGDARPGS